MSPVQVFEANRLILQYLDIAGTEGVIDRSETDTKLEIITSTTLLDRSHYLGRAALLEVARPYAAFARTARWICCASYKDPERPKSLSVAHVTLFPEGEPYMKLPIVEEGVDPAESMLEDLHTLGVAYA